MIYSQHYSHKDLRQSEELQSENASIVSTYIQAQIMSKASQNMNATTYIY